MSKPRKKQLPFLSSGMESATWSSVSGGSSEDSSYAWSNSLSSSEGDSDDFSGSDYSSLSDDSSYDDDDSYTVDRPEMTKSAPKPNIPQPPPSMPVEGLDLSMLAKLKSDLLKVGQAIVQSDVGKIEAERAQTLASINWLSGHVPNAVLEHLGHETRNTLKDEGGGSQSDGSNGGGLLSAVKQDDDMSQVSELSDQYMEDMEQKQAAQDMPQGMTPGYGDLGVLSHEKMTSFLPTGIGPMGGLPGQTLLAGVDELAPIDMTGDDNITDSFLADLAGPSGQRQAAGTDGYGDLASVQGSMAGSMAGKSRKSISGSASVASGSRRRKISGSASVVSRGSRSSRTSRRSANRFASGNGSVSSGRSRQRRASIALGDSFSAFSSNHSASGRRRKKKGSSGENAKSNGDSGSVISAGNRSIGSRKSKKRGMKGLFKRIYNRTTPSTGQGPSIRIDVPDTMINSMDDSFSGPAVVSPREANTQAPPPMKMATEDSNGEEKKESISDEKIASGGPLLEIERPKEKSLPRSQLYLCSLLFVDISGFTKLSTMLDPESLSKVSKLANSVAATCSSAVFLFVGMISGTIRYSLTTSILSKNHRLSTHTFSLLLTK